MIWGGLTGTGKMAVSRRSPERAHRLDAVDFFSALTGPELLARTEVPRPEHREHVHGRPHFAKRSSCSGGQVKIAPVHPDFWCEQCSLSLMGFASRHLDRLRALAVPRVEWALPAAV